MFRSQSFPNGTQGIRLAGREFKSQPRHLLAEQFLAGCLLTFFCALVSPFVKEMDTINWRLIDAKCLDDCLPGSKLQ